MNKKVSPVNIQLGEPPYNLILDIADEYKVSNFIETGTGEAETSEWASNYFKKVISIEIDESKYKNAMRNKPDNVEYILGSSSSSVLENTLNKIEGPSIVWLDAHSSGGPVPDGLTECPLLTELDTIKQHADDIYIFIDDARYFLSPPVSELKPEDWPSISEVIDKLKDINPDFYIVVTQDTIIAVPESEKRIVESYCVDVAEQRDVGITVKMAMKKLYQRLI